MEGDPGGVATPPHSTPTPTGAHPGETAGPYCTGKALDAIQHGDGPTVFTIGLVLAADLGRWGSLCPPCLSVPCSRADGVLCVPSTPPHPAPSSLFAGCRGGLFTLAQARLKLGICYQLFSRLLRQDLAFFQGTPAGRGGSPSFPPRPQGPQPHH